MALNKLMYSIGKNLLFNGSSICLLSIFLNIFLLVGRFLGKSKQSLIQVVLAFVLFYNVNQIHFMAVLLLCALMFKMFHDEPAPLKELRSYKFLLKRLQIPYIIFNRSASVSDYYNIGSFNCHSQTINSTLTLFATENGQSLKRTALSLFSQPIGYSNANKYFFPQITANIANLVFQVTCIRISHAKVMAVFKSMAIEENIKRISQNEKLQLRLVSTMSHQLRNPLNGVIGIFEKLKSICDKEIHSLIKIGISSSYLLMQNIDSFIDLSQTMCNQLKIEYSYINFESLLNKMKKLITPLLKKSIQFQIKKDILLPSKFLHDQEKIYRILVRLILNSIKYTLQGHITLEICLRTNSDIQFIVADTGIGMDVECIASIKKSTLSLIPNRTTDNIPLAGLGLATIQLLLEKFNAKLDISSKLGQGTTFSFILSIKDSSYRSKSKSIHNFPDALQSERKLKSKFIPEEYDNDAGILKPSSKEHIESSISTKMQSGTSNNDYLAMAKSKVHALIVDDCTINRMVHRLLLSKYSNISITEHTNGAEAVEYVNILEGLSPRKVLIFMDINMPIMDGIEATKAIRRKQYGFTISIIAVSAFSNSKEIELIEDSGIDTYITKPMTKEKMEKVLSIFY